MIQKSSYILMKHDPSIILKSFLNFSNFEPRYSFKLYSYKKRAYPCPKNLNQVKVTVEKYNVMDIKEGQYFPRFWQGKISNTEELYTIQTIMELRNNFE